MSNGHWLTEQAEPTLSTAQTDLTHVLLNLFGSDAWDDSAKETAARVMRYWQEFAAPPAEIGCPLPFSFTTFESHGGQMVVVSADVISLCAHHLLPIVGTAYVGYIPGQIQVGLSKIPRLVDFWARRPQVQEQLTSQIARDLKHRLNPQGVMVVIKAQHSCMCARGVRNHDGRMMTSLPIGMFLSSPPARDEFFQLLRGDL